MADSSPLMAAAMALTMLRTTPSTVETAVCTMETMRPHTVETVAAMALQAASHSPRSTAVKKSARPRSTASARVMASAMIPAAPVTAMPTAVNTCTATGASVAISHCTSGARIVFQTVSSSAATAPRQAVSSFQSGCRCADQSAASRSNSCKNTGCTTPPHSAERMLTTFCHPWASPSKIG